MEWDIVEEYYYWDMNPNKTYLKNKIGLYKYLIKLKMSSIYDYYKNRYMEPMQETCNTLIKENFYLKQQVDKYKSTYKKLKINMPLVSKSRIREWIENLEKAEEKLETAENQLYKQQKDYEKLQKSVSKLKSSNTKLRKQIKNCNCEE
tara:strand:- start:3438 stop:3881 length:444 start_codon:yes stop_codon:yes gene_type:complete